MKIIQTDCETPEELLNHVLSQIAETDEDRVRGWCDATLAASFWFSLAGVGPLEAAQLLSQFSPETAPGDWFKHTTDHTTPTEHQILLRGFEDIGGRRPLLDWMDEAKSRGWRYHPWADEYVQVVGVDNLRDRIREAPPAEPVAPVKKPIKDSAEQRQARRAQMCIDAGLELPANDYAHFPRGVGVLAKREGVTRQAFVEDVRKHIARSSAK